MAFYSLTDEHLLQMPAKRFWLLEKNIGRLNAEFDLRQLNVISAPNLKNPQDVQQRLVEELGTIIIVNAKRDEDAADRLRLLGGAR